MADAGPGDHVAGRHELTLAEWTRIAPEVVRFAEENGKVTRLDVGDGYSLRVEPQ